MEMHFQNQFIYLFNFFLKILVFLNLKLTFCSTPNCKSALSFSDTAGKSTGKPGKLTPFLLPSLPPFSISHSSSVGSNLKKANL